MTEIKVNPAEIEFLPTKRLHPVPPISSRKTRSHHSAKRSIVQSPPAASASAAPTREDASQKSTSASSTQMVNLWTDYPQTKEIAFDERLGEYARQLSRCRHVRIYHDHAMIKPPGQVSKQTNWHQDAP